MPPCPSRRRLLAACLPLAWGGAAAAPATVVLTVTGLIGATEPAGTSPRAEFDMARLAALPQHSFSTHTPWDKGPRTFTGPLLRELLASVQARGHTLLASALNAYKVEIPVADTLQYPVIVARLVDGQPMRVRDRGPLFVIYPFDSDRALRSESYYARSIWQLRAIEVR
ncbi:MAG TPA: hypothetical protein VLA16_19615 [Ideonella sp.]|nr:hypothetical protein [Ideonella sp.]